MPAGSRGLLALASLAVALAAADTYVVVLALPDMMAGVGLSIDDLQRATPVISGFLLGYIAVLPLIGRLSDFVSRRRVLLWCLGLFVVGSAVTALAVDLPVLVAGRVVQGIGGGGLVPATLALVADLWPAHRRGVPLGLVGAVQEVGSVLGPLLGALVLAVATWREIFWLNVVLGLLLAAALVVLARRADPTARARLDAAGRAPKTNATGPGAVEPEAPGPGAAAPDTADTAHVTAAPNHGAPPNRGPQPNHSARPNRGPGLARAALLALGLVSLHFALLAPPALVRDVTWGLPFVPLGMTGFWAWLGRLGTPIGVAALLLLVLWTVAALYAGRRVLARVDVIGALLVATALGSLVLTFASANPEEEVVGPLGWVLVPVGLIAVLLAWWWHGRAPQPLVPRGIVTRRVGAGLLTSLAVGAALVAVVVDVPVLARLTLTDSQTQAALVLVRFLIALPVGALLGGFALRRLGNGAVAAPGLLLAAGGLAVMATWERGSLDHPVSTTVVLVAVGLGLGLAIAPVNAAVLDDVHADSHGVAGALVVVARMIGMVVGLALLTAWGLRRFYQHVETLPDLLDAQALLDAGLVQVQSVFAGAAACALAGAVAALFLGLRRE
nr:MFS transporter [Kineosphaera limosa]